MKMSVLYHKLAQLHTEHGNLPVIVNVDGDLHDGGGIIIVGFDYVLDSYSARSKVPPILLKQQSG